MITLRYRESTPQVAPVSLPGSKSMAARALIINSIAESPARITGLPHCEDTDTLRRALEVLAEKMPATINAGAAGTAMRFITAVAAATPGAEITLTGTDRMKQRPISPIVDALRQIGAEISYEGHEGYPPIRIYGRQLTGGDVNIRADVSSQFISALMMIAPLCSAPLHIHRDGARTVSRPYIAMTAQMMRTFGADVREEGSDIIIGNAPYQAPEMFAIESDWSAASYFFEIASQLGGREVLIKSLPRPEESCQGDAHCARLFEALGVSTEYLADGSAVLRGGGATRMQDIDMSETPDLVPALAVAHCLCGVPFRFKGIDHLRLKECDRLAVIVGQLRKLGFVAEAHDDVLSWDGETSTPDTDNPIRTHDDHRIAMSFAPAVYKFKEIVILHEGVVDKSYPLFWQNIENLGIQIYY